MKVIAAAWPGPWGQSPDVVTAPEYLDITLPAGAEIVRPVPRGHTAFAYVIEGAGYSLPIAIRLRTRSRAPVTSI